MRVYLDVLRHILDQGVERENRTGVNTIGVFGHQARFDLLVGFPLLTTKKVFFRGVVAELLWFLSGDTNAKTLQGQGVHIWDEWATAEKCDKFGRETGDLGPVYGWQWCHFGAPYLGPRLVTEDGFNQIRHAIDTILHQPNSRRIIVTAWNPFDAEEVELPPCHTLFQFYVQNGMLSCHLYGRSIDAFLGLPFNIASYALLTHLVARATGLRAKELIISFGDLHIYANHVAQVHQQLARNCRPLPWLSFEEGAPTNIFAMRAEYIHIRNYDPHPAIKAEVAV